MTFIIIIKRLIITKFYRDIKTNFIYLYTNNKGDLSNGMRTMIYIP